MESITTVAPDKNNRLIMYVVGSLVAIISFMSGWLGCFYALNYVSNLTGDTTNQKYTDEIPLENEITQETVVEESNDMPSNQMPQSDFVEIGQKIGQMTVFEARPFKESYSEMAPENIQMILKGPIEITGSYEFFKSEIGFSGYCMSDFTDESIAKLPYVPAYLPLASEYGKPAELLCFRNELVASDLLGDSPRRVTVLVDNYELNSYPSEVVDKVDLVEVISDFPPRVDVSACEIGVLNGPGGFRSSLSLHILGESKYDGYCHVISIEQTSMGAGAYWLQECWIPKSLGYISGQENDAYVAGYSMPNIREYYTEMSTWEGSLNES